MPLLLKERGVFPLSHVTVPGHYTSLLHSSRLLLMTAAQIQNLLLPPNSDLGTWMLAVMSTERSASAILGADRPSRSGYGLGTQGRCEGG